MNKIKSSLLTGIALLTGLIVQAQDHAHGAPHQGTVKTAGNYHIEMVKSGAKISIYLLDAKEQTLSTSQVTGTLILQWEDKTTVHSTLVAVGDHLEVVLKKQQPFNAVVSLKVKGKTVSATFPKSGQTPVHDHTTHPHSH